MIIVNLTKHPIVVQDGEVKHVFDPIGQECRVASATIDVAHVNGIPVSYQTFGEVQGLPAPVEGTVYIVSAMVLAALKGKRNDVVAPRTDGTAIRNESGQITAVRGFVI